MKNHKDAVYALIIACIIAFNISGFIALVLNTTKHLMLFKDELNGIRRNVIRSCVNYDDIKHLRTPPFANKDGWYSAGPTPTIEEVVNKYHEVLRAEYEQESD